MPEKPIIKYASAEEAALVAERVKTFAFDEDPPSANTILLVGEDGSGKTHFACTMKELGPVYILDTELRADKVATVMFGIKTIVRVYDYIGMYAAVRGIIAKFKPPGTIVFDSGTDLTKFAGQRFMDEAKLDKIYPVVLYDEVYRKCDAVYNACRRAGFNVVITGQMKDEYVGENRTGKMIPKIYNRLFYTADITVLCNKDKTKKLLKRPYGIDMEYPFKLETTLPKLINDLKPTGGPNGSGISGQS